MLRVPVGGKAGNQGVGKASADEQNALWAARRSRNDRQEEPYSHNDRECATSSEAESYHDDREELKERSSKKVLRREDGPPELGVKILRSATRRFCFRKSNSWLGGVRAKGEVPFKKSNQGPR